MAIKNYFSAPPEFGSAEFEISFQKDQPKNIEIKTSSIQPVKKDEIEKSIIEEIVKHDEIKTITLNSQTYNNYQI